MHQDYLIDKQIEDAEAMMTKTKT